MRTLWYTTPLASQLIRKQVGTWWYTTLLTSQLIRKQVGGFIFDVGLLGPCRKHAEEAEDVASMPRTLRSMPRRPRTLPSMPKSCQASLHILGSHRCNLVLCFKFFAFLSSFIVKYYLIAL